MASVSIPAFLSAPSCERVEILKPPSLVEGSKVGAARQYQYCYFSHLLILVLGFRNPALLYKCTLLLGDTVGEGAREKFERGCDGGDLLLMFEKF